jgi:hypothetical protein
MEQRQPPEPPAERFPDPRPPDEAEAGRGVEAQPTSGPEVPEEDPGATPGPGPTAPTGAPIGTGPAVEPLGERPPAVERAREERAPGEVIGNLPRTRPQRRTQRRRTTTQRRSGAAAASKRPATERNRAAAVARQTRRTRAASSGTTRSAATPAAPVSSRIERESAPGMPELALSAAVGAAKLPFKVTSALTRRTTRMIGRAARIR